METPDCNSDLCENDGVCLPAEVVQRPSGLGAVPAGTVHCLCKPGFTGANCGTRMSTCLENPCHPDARCVEDPSGGTGYYCDCENTGRLGRHCELEANHCSGGCRNGGTCLTQPMAYLCECPPNFGGLRCDNPRQPVSFTRLMSCPLRPSSYSLTTLGRKHYILYANYRLLSSKSNTNQQQMHFEEAIFFPR